MSDVVSPAPAPEPQRPGAEPQVARRTTMFADPVVRKMGYVALGLVMVFLVTVVSALITGVIASTGPRTRAEKDVAVSGAAVLGGSKDPSVWSDYISALIASGQYSRAKDVIAQGKASINDSATATFALAEARLLTAQGDQAGAIAVATAAQKTMEAVQKTALASGGMTAKTAVIVGLPDNYYDATLVKAYAYRDLKQWTSAVKELDVYIAHIPGASDILVDRGNVKVAMGDKTGAENDFRSALRFVPDDKEALAGLKKIGAVR